MDNLELYSFQKLSPRKSIASYDKRSSKKVNRNVGKFDKGMALESNLGQKLKDNLAEFKINLQCHDNTSSEDDSNDGEYKNEKYYQHFLDDLYNENKKEPKKHSSPNPIHCLSPLTKQKKLKSKRGSLPIFDNGPLNSKNVSLKKKRFSCMMINQTEHNNEMNNKIDDNVSNCQSMKSISYLKTNTNVNNNNNKDIICLPNNNIKQKRRTFLCCIPIK